MGPLKIDRGKDFKDRPGAWVEFIAGHAPVFVASDHWVGFDFDGTISRNDNKGHFAPPYPLGEPIPEMIATIKSLLEAEIIVKIFTARACEPDNIPAIQEWTERHGLGRLEVTHQKDYYLIRFFDDRAIPMLDTRDYQLPHSQVQINLRRRMSKLSPENRAKIEKNIFRGAHSAIADWDAYPWHRHKDQITTGWNQSSQALSIDLFGTVKAMKSQAARDAVMNRVAEELGLAADQDWKIELEWEDRENRLNEPRETQVDVKAEGRNTLIFFECKFTELGGGSCSQTGKDKQRLAQCSGSYKLQTNPKNGKEAWCALTGKGIKYWDHIPEIFIYDSKQEYAHCPFKGGWYQWMRNLVLCRAFARDGMKFCVAVVFADSANLPFPKRIKGGEWKDFQKSLKDSSVIGLLTYQKILEMCDPVLKPHGAEANDWKQLREHIQKKLTTENARAVA